MTRKLMCLLVIAVAGCAGGYREPPRVTPPPAIGDVERSGSELTVRGLVEYGRSFPFRYRSKGTGDMVISRDRIEWRNNDATDRSFSIQPSVVREVVLECAARAGENVCLELQVETVTNLRYAFRDPNWAAGQNGRIMEAWDHLKQMFPRVVFRQESVDEIK